MPGFFPERLIDVSTSNLRLVERNDINGDLATRPQYAALSYCWGPPHEAEYQSKTTTKNLAKQFEGLNFDALSFVLQDAVKATRNLRIPYLWVDSLCILQDDISDWHKQCSQMSDIYGKARVTLIAASSRSCNEGFLVPRRRFRRRLHLPYQSSRCPNIIGSFIVYFTHASSPVIFSSWVSELSADLLYCQWARRGWTFQENAMASTCIVFGNTDVYLGRHSAFVSRYGAAGYVGTRSIANVRPNESPHQAWVSVLKRYSQFTAASFTNPTDLLPALSGLARLFGNILQTEYIAGHWVDRLHYSLAFTVDPAVRAEIGESRLWLNDIAKHLVRQTYLVPTWSCLASGGFAIWQVYSRCRSEVTVIDCHSQLVSEDPYGAIEDASLTLEGFVLDLASLTWSQPSTRKLMGYMDSRNGLTHLQFDEHTWSNLQWTYFSVYDPGHARGPNCPGCQYFMSLDFKINSEAGQVHLHQLIPQMSLLLLGSEEKKNEDDLDCTGGYGLLLVPVGDAPQHSFIRVGAFASRVAQTGDHFEVLKKMMKQKRITMI